MEIDMDTIDSPEAASFIDDDKYEDAGELDMSQSSDNVVLTRLPKMFWEALTKMQDEDEVRIGTIRMEGHQTNSGRMSIMLDSHSSALKLVPHEYNLRHLDNSNSSTFVFSEKDLPGFVRRHQGRRNVPQLASRLQPQDKGREHSSRDRGSRARNFRIPGYRRAIPKKTALLGHVTAESNCLPVESEHYAKVMDQRLRHHKPKAALHMMSEEESRQAMTQQNALGVSSSFSSFIKTAPPREKKQQQKAARMPKNELMDLLFGYFAQYKYWYLKDLKTQTRQPEAYLREVLEPIAELMRQGTHANTWRLKASIMLDGKVDAKKFDDAEEKVAPSVLAGYDGTSDIADDGDDDGDDENVKMEDVDII